MQSTLLPAITLPHEAWKLIETDFTLRHSLVANQFAEEYNKAKHQLFRENIERSNSGFLLPAWSDLIISDADKRSEWAFKTCCEIWEIQGRTQCSAFFHAVFEYCIAHMIGVRASGFKGEINLYKMRTKRDFGNQESAVLGELKRKEMGLNSKWKTKLTIATRDAEHRQRLAQIQVAQSAMMNESETMAKSSGNLKSEPSATGAEPRLTWETLESRFNSIQAKALSTGGVLVEYGWEAQNVDPATSTFHLRGDAILLLEYKSLANIAGQKLGCTGSFEECIKTWLDSVFSMVLRDGYSKYELYISRLIGDGNAPGKEYVSEYYRSDQIAKLSALYCLLMQGKPMLPKVEADSKSGQGAENGEINHAHEICLAEDQRSVKIHGIEYPLSKCQGKMMEILINAYFAKKDFVTKRELCKVITSSSNPRDSFKRSPLWQTVIKSENDRYWVDLSSSVGNKKTATKRPLKGRKTATKKIV